MVSHVQQKSPWLYPCYYLCRRRFGHLCNWETCQPQRWIQTRNPCEFSFAKKAIKLTKNKITKIKEKKKNCKALSKVKCIQISYKKCLIWPFIGRVCYREVSSRWYCKLGPRNVIRYRGVRYIEVLLWEFDRHLSVPEKSVRCREVSNIRRFHCKPEIFRTSHDKDLSLSSPWVCIYFNGLSPERVIL